MLHHISIAVQQPHHVAQVLAELMKGCYFPFPPNPGSYIILAGDRYGTAIEVLPSGTELYPGDAEVEFSQNAFSSDFSAFHAAISVPVDQATIEQVAAREGWEVRLCDRGPFSVVEFWIENRFMLELLPPAIAHRYTEFMTFENWEKAIAEMQVAA